MNSLDELGYEVANAHETGRMILKSLMANISSRSIVSGLCWWVSVVISIFIKVLLYGILIVSIRSKDRSLVNYWNPLLIANTSSAQSSGNICITMQKTCGERQWFWIWVG